MTAEEMFKKLGYEKSKYSDDNWIYYNRYWFGEFYGGTPAHRRIAIDLKEKTINLSESNLSGYFVDFIATKDLLKAINKQIEELGW